MLVDKIWGMRSPLLKQEFYTSGQLASKCHETPFFIRMHNKSHRDEILSYDIPTRFIRRVFGKSFRLKFLSRKISIFSAKLFAVHVGTFTKEIFFFEIGKFVFFAFFRWVFDICFRT